MKEVIRYDGYVMIYNCVFHNNLWVSEFRIIFLCVLISVIINFGTKCLLDIHWITNQRNIRSSKSSYVKDN